MLKAWVALWMLGLIVGLLVPLIVPIFFLAVFVLMVCTAWFFWRVLGSWLIFGPRRSR